MLKDEITIKVKSGNGGLGAYSLLKTEVTGGDGGNGGDVYVEGSENIYDLRRFNNLKTYKAGSGFNGRHNRKQGKNGDDLILKLPLVTDIYVDGVFYKSITEHGQRELILKGGKGALGNMSLKKLSKDGYIEDIPNEAEKGRIAELKLILKLKSDVIFLGFPNAGKSSLLNELSNANVKIADYAFTTLEPQIGLMDGVILMDLPGLIEGTSEGKGLGTSFIKHTETAKLVLHTVSLEEPNALETYFNLREEIKKLSTELYTKEELVVLTKYDSISKDELEKIQKEFKKKKIETIAVSILDDNSITTLKDLLIKKFKSHKKT